MFFCLHNGLVDVYLIYFSDGFKFFFENYDLRIIEIQKNGACKYPYHAVQAVRFIRSNSVSYPNIHTKHLYIRDKFETF